MSIVSPSATKTTISARLASAVWKRSISPLYGARASPIRMPGDEDGEEAGAVRDGRDAVDDAGRGERPQRVQRLVRQRDSGAARQQQVRADDADREADRHLDTNSRTTDQNVPSSRSWRARSSRSSARCRPGRSRPTRPRGSCRSARRPRAARAPRTSPRGRSARARRRRSRPSSRRSRTASARRARAARRSRTCRRRRASAIGHRPRRGSAASRRACRRRRGSRSARRRRSARPSTREISERGKASERRAAARRNSAGPGTRIFSLSRLVPIARAKRRPRGARPPRTREARPSGRLYGRERRPFFHRASFRGTGKRAELLTRRLTLP